MLGLRASRPPDAPKRQLALLVGRRAYRALNGGDARGPRSTQIFPRCLAPIRDRNQERAVFD
jgi:hypothetical protein